VLERCVPFSSSRIDLQIILLQVGPDLDTRITVLLLVLALAEIKWDKWSMTVASTGIYLAVVLGQIVSRAAE